MAKKNTAPASSSAPAVPHLLDKSGNGNLVGTCKACGHSNCSLFLTSEDPGGAGAGSPATPDRVGVCAPCKAAMLEAGTLLLDPPATEEEEED